MTFLMIFKTLQLFILMMFLVFSLNIEKHFKHINIFIDVIKRNGLVVSLPKVKLFETKIRFLGFKIHLGKIKPIQRSIEFASNFSDQILDKTQLQRFLDCLNYVYDFIQNLIPICKPLYQRLKKNPNPWSDTHTQTIQKIKSLVKLIPCLNLINTKANLIVETDASNLGYEGILKECLDKTESII